MEHWYVYFKLAERAVSDVAPRVRAMMDTLCAATGARGKLLRRVDSDHGAATLMEVYNRIDDGRSFGAALERAVASAQLPPDLIAARRVERFKEF